MSKRLSSDQFAEFIAASAPESLRGTRLGAFDGFWGGRRCRHENPDSLVWRDRCLEHGLTAPTWPEADGGGGLGAEEYTAWEQALVDAKVPPPVVGFGLTMIGPTLLHYGTGAQDWNTSQRSSAATCAGVRATPSQGRGATWRA